MTTLISSTYIEFDEQGSAPSTPASSKARLYVDSKGILRWLNDDGTTGTGVLRGTAFPSSPATNDIFFRTDHGRSYYYTGSAWAPFPNTSPALYTTAAAQSFTTGITAIINFGTSVYDPASRVTTGASWKYTADLTGVYLVSAGVLWAGTTTWNAGEVGAMWVYKNNSLLYTLDYRDGLNGGATQFMAVRGTAFVSLTASDFIDVRAQQASGGTLALTANAIENYVGIARVY